MTQYSSAEDARQAIVDALEKHAIENTREKERKQTSRDTNAPKDKTEEITIYSVDSCQGCRITAQMLEKAGIPFQVVDLSQRPDLIRSIVSSMNAPDPKAIHNAGQQGADASHVPEAAPQQHGQTR